jgi:quercetin dioxygenase-like cupin family protein
MRRMSQYAFLLCLGCLGATFIAAAQVTGNEVEITNEPHHHLTFENQYVRVFNVEVDPNTETKTHWHHHDYIAVTLGDAEVSNTVKDKPAVTVKLPDGDTRFISGNFAHFVRDVGPQPFRNVTIEILQDESLRDLAARGKVHWDEDRGLDILAKGTKEILFVKDGIRVSEFDLQPGGIVPAYHYTGPHLLVAVSDLDIRSDVKNNTASGHFKSGDSKWLPAGYSHAITNASSSPATFVTLEFP